VRVPRAEPTDYTQDDSAFVAQPPAGGRTSQMASIAGAVASLALVIGAGVWGYGVMARDVSGVPVVQAMSGPMRVAPEDPGGTLTDHQGLAVNSVAGLGVAEGPAEQLILAPRPAGLAAEDVAAGALVPLETAPMEASMPGQAEAMELGSESELADANGVMALVDQLAAVDAPLTPLESSGTTEEEDFSDVQDVSSALAEVLGSEEDGAEMDEPQSVTALAGPGVAQSLRPKLRPSGLRVASVDTTAVATDAALADVLSSVTKEIDPASLATGTRLVQIGAFDSPETARAEWQRLETRFGEYLDGKARVIQKATSGGRVFYRLRAEGFADLSDARRFCAAFVAQNVDCIPVVTR
jgi:hypothetical protein